MSGSWRVKVRTTHQKSEMRLEGMWVGDNEEDPYLLRLCNTRAMALERFLFLLGVFRDIPRSSAWARGEAYVLVGATGAFEGSMCLSFRRAE
jgi:hypothetical protein